MTETSIYEWLRAGKRRGTDAGDLAPGSTGPGPAEEEDPKDLTSRLIICSSVPKVYVVVTGKASQATVFSK